MERVLCSLRVESRLRQGSRAVPALGRDCRWGRREGVMHLGTSFQLDLSVY